ncbi:uncharacterized protein [Aquarana catesbeiana]|uniref:uncharacterized protein isoform X2 n=1 Tax=Aquarana catesbeiana TaxID=8400 RepID=UPI003CC9DA18
MPFMINRMIMWLSDFSAIGMLFLSTGLTSAFDMQKKGAPPGTDITLTCPSSKVGGPSRSVSIPTKRNIRQFSYEDTLYIIISDFSEYHKGPYLCINSNGTILEFNEISTSEAIIKFRSVGDNLLLICSIMKKVTYVKWQWTSSDSLNSATIQVNSGNQITSNGPFHVETTDEADFAIKISPVSFNDSGQYKCYFPDGSAGIVVNLVTVEVKIHPSELVHQGSDAHLTCSVSHLLPSINIMLLWVQMNATSSTPVKSRKLSIMHMENSLHVKNVNENRTDWSCLVFNNNFLVGFIQTKLNYTMKPNFESTTSDYETEPSPALDDEETSSAKGIHVFRITIRSLVSFMVLVLFTIYTIKILSCFECRNSITCKP